MADNRTAKAAKKLAEANRWKGVSDRFCTRDAAKLESEAAELLTPEAPAEVVLGEVVPPAEGTPAARSRALEMRDTLANPDQVALDASAERTELLLRDAVDVTALALDVADTIDADNSLEKMLAHQLALAHKASFEIADTSLGLLQRIDGLRDPRAIQTLSTESARLMNASARMMQSFQQGLTTLQKIRTGGNQTMTVQHVHVSDGGQVLIGNVAGEGRAGAKRRSER